jgi:hypothetical protein
MFEEVGAYDEDISFSALEEWKCIWYGLLVKPVGKRETRLAESGSRQ